MRLTRAQGFRRLGIGRVLVALVLGVVVLGAVIAWLLWPSNEDPDTSQLRSATPPGAATITGRAQPIREPGILVVNSVPIRLARLSCPSRDTEAAATASARMAVLVGTQPLECDLFGRRVDGMRLGQCRLPDGTDLAARLRAEGKCRGGWFWR